MTDGLTAYNLAVDSGSLTVTDDTQALTLPEQAIAICIWATVCGCLRALRRRLPGKTYMRFTNVWDVTYQSESDGSGDDRRRRRDVWL